MDIDKWGELKESLKKKFDIEEEGREELVVDTQEGEVLRGTADFLIMTTPIGRVKLAFETKPLVLNKKFISSHRAGQAARTEYEMSDSEFTYKLRAYKWNDIDETWNEIDAEHFG